MPLYVVELDNSDTWAMAADIPGASRACINLWTRAWHQVPAASLPNDDRRLARYADVPDWDAVRDIALRGFVECSDGRLYHLHLAKKAIEAGEQQERTAEEREKHRQKMKKLRERQKQQQNQPPRDPSRDDNVTDTCSARADHVPSMTGEGEEKTLKEKKEKEKRESPARNPDAASLASPSDSGSLRGALEGDSDGSALDDDVPFGKPELGAGLSDLAQNEDGQYNRSSMTELLASAGIGRGAQLALSTDKKASYDCPWGGRMHVTRPEGVDGDWPEKVT